MAPAPVTGVVTFTGSAAATRNCCAEDRTALVSKTAHAQMSFLVGVDIGFRLGCVDCRLVKAGTRPASGAFLRRVLAELSSNNRNLVDSRRADVRQPAFQCGARIACDSAGSTTVDPTRCRRGRSERNPAPSC